MNSVDFYTEVVGDVTSVSTNRSGHVSDSASPRKRGRVSDSEEVIAPFSYTDAVILSRKHDVDMQLADGTMWSNYSWINDGHEVRLDMSVGGLDTEAREEVFRGSRSKYFKMDEALADTAAEYLLVQVIDDESDFYKEWMWKNPSKELFETVARVVAEVRGSEPSAEDATVLLDRDLPTSDSGYVQDSAEVAKIVGERVGKSVKKACVKDDATSTYADLADALEAAGIPYALEAYVIWANEQKFDGHGNRADAGQIQIYGMAAGAFEDRYDELSALYKSGSDPEFYEKAPLEVLGIQVYDVKSDNGPSVEWNIINPTIGQVREIIDAALFCSDEHLSSDEVVSYLDNDLELKSNKVSDSAPCVCRGKKVSDASEEVVYDTLAEAFNKNGIDYSMEDYVLWSEQIKLDNHDQGDEAMLIVYAKSKDALDGDEARLDALYDEEGIDGFYAKADISTVGVQLFKKFGDYGVAPKEYTVTNPTKSQIDDIFDAVMFCHEEHCGYEEADAHLDEVFGPMNNASITEGE